ncbi:MAG TPA: M3 family metallopeptidase [Steroidobacteraceae bacterium]|nr:M3 family metallopeptidase [Steroidobacteraceae bacterium]
MSANPVLEPSVLPYQMPPFDRIRVSDYVPAFEAAMRAQLQEVSAIAHDPKPPTFANTIVALDRSGQALQRVSFIFDELNSNNTNDEMQKIDTEMAPKRSAHRDAIYLDRALWQRVDAVYQKRTMLKLDPESLQLVTRWHARFVRAGARLAAADQARLRALNAQIAALTTKFGQNVLKATTEGAITVDKAEDLKGLSAEQVSAAAQAAETRGLKGKWLITLQNTTQQPVLAHLDNRMLRERIFKASVERGLGGATDNRAVVTGIVKARAERAALLGYDSHAAYAIEDESAATPAAARELLLKIAPAALARAREEAADLQRLIDTQAKAQGTPSFTLQPWDWEFYSEQVRKTRYDFDQSEVAPYFELNRVVQDGVFYAAHQLYGLTFKERKDLPVYQPDVRVFEVFDADGSGLGLFIADYFARDNKQGGAWMNAYVEQSRLLKRKVVVSNNINIPKPAAGQPVLLSFDEVTTLFHEFGHALHGLLSDVEYPTLASPETPPDFVEYPSQFNEMWAREPQIVAHYAYHYRSNAPMPPELLAKVLRAQQFNQGYATTEYVAAALLDLAWYQLHAAQVPTPDEVPAFEAAALKEAGVDYAPVPPRYHTAYFSHIFNNDYSAGYYAYLWSEVLARDTGAWIHAHGGVTRANGDELRRRVLSRGRTAEPLELFRDLYGRGPEVGPLLEYHSLGGD